jgi:serine/threonine protein kinase
VLAGRYHLLEKIGEGGMGSVFVARDERSSDDAQREVAIKVLHKTLITDDGAIARFRNEARAASTIDHPNVCRVLDVGEFEGAPFLVMERLVGENLATRLAREQTLPPVRAAEIVVELLAGLEAAHGRGVLHRDLKPENIFLARDGETTVAKIVDFGVAKFVGDDAERVKMTRTGALVGTPAYMSPEQALGEEVDVRSDVWATGVLLFEMLAGRLPFDAANYNAMLVKIATEPPPPIRTVLPALDGNLADLVDRALARRREERFGSAAEMAAAMRAWLAGAPLRLAVPRVAMPTPLFSTTPMSWAEQESGATHMKTLSGTSLPQRQRSWLTPAVLVVVLGVAGFAIAMGIRRNGAKTTLATTTVAPGRGNDHAEQNEFQLNVIGVPAGSRVRVNGADATLPVRVRRGQSARVEIDAVGFETWSQTVIPTGDVTMGFEPHAIRPVPVPVASNVAAVDADAAASGGDASATGTAPPAQRNGAIRRRNGRQNLQGGVAPRPDF